MNLAHRRLLPPSRTWKYGFLVIVSLILTACTSASPDSTSAEVSIAVPFTEMASLSSPNDELRIEVGLDELDRPRYRILRTFEGADIEVVGDSTFGLETSFGSFATATELAVSGPSRLIADEFTLPHGKATTSRIAARAQTIKADELRIDLWVADTAVAFRYRVDAPDTRSPGTQATIEWERTSFSLPPQAQAWLQPHDAPTRFTPAYEQPRDRAATIDQLPRSEFGWTFPGLFNADGQWTLITETALGDGAAASHFSPAVTNGEFLIDFASRGDGNGVGDPRPIAVNEWTSPWRLIVSSTQLSDIVESNHVRHLSPPHSPDLAFDWVQPGRVSWSWWSDHASSRDADQIVPFIDLAAEMGWEYSLVDANWDGFGTERLEELVDYALDRNVKLMLWYNSGGPNNAVTEAPRNRMTDAETRRAEFAWLQEIGIAGVKVDFFQSDKPATIQQYRDIMADAADANLLVNFHGSTLPRGWQRTFPNLMTMEAVRGAEFYTFDQVFQRSAPWANTILPFTRNVVGPMDYTPVVLGNQFRRTTTNGHELGLAVVFESALLHLVDTPDVYLAQPAQVIDLLATVPTVWDETRFIDGAPESHVVIARRRGSSWWIGAIQGTNETIATTVDLRSLGIDPDAQVLRVCDEVRPLDAADAESQAFAQMPYVITATQAGESLGLQLEPYGGCLIRIG